MIPAVNDGKRHSVRIIGGSWRGRRIAVPDLPGLRPTPDRVRETLFNWLQFDIAQTRCLDLFAGTGVLGFEALSRGAAEVVFVEQAESAARSLHEHIGQFGAGGHARVRSMDATRFLAGPADAFDVVFLDPPFAQGLVPPSLAALAAGPWLRSGGFAYVESERTAGEPLPPAGWSLTRSKYAGEVGYHLMRRGV